MRRDPIRKRLDLPLELSQLVRQARAPIAQELVVPLAQLEESAIEFPPGKRGVELFLPHL